MLCGMVRVRSLVLDVRTLRCVLDTDVAMSDSTWRLCMSKRLGLVMYF